MSQTNRQAALSCAVSFMSPAAEVTSDAVLVVADKFAAWLEEQGGELVRGDLDDLLPDPISFSHAITSSDNDKLRRHTPQEEEGVVQDTLARVFAGSLLGVLDIQPILPLLRDDPETDELRWLANNVETSYRQHDELSEAHVQESARLTAKLALLPPEEANATHPDYVALQSYLRGYAAQLDRRKEWQAAGLLAWAVSQKSVVVAREILDKPSSARTSDTLKLGECRQYVLSVPQQIVWPELLPSTEEEHYTFIQRLEKADMPWNA